MVNHKLKDLRGPQRRTFLRLMGAAAAGFALERSRFLNLLLDQGGSALADDAACADTNRHVGIISGGGSYCLWQLMWPLPDVAMAKNSAFAYGPDIESATPGFLHNAQAPFFQAGPNDRPFYYGPSSPFVDFQTNTPLRPMTAYLTADPVVHHRKPLRQITIDGALPGNAQGADDGLAGGSVTLFAAIAAEQRSTVSILPSIGVAPASMGSAPGAPALAVVPSGDAMVDLFNSAAARAILNAQQDKDMFETYYKAVLGLRDAAGRPTWSRELDIAKKASNLLGRNLAAQLQPTAADMTFYGADQIAGASVFDGNNGKTRLLNLARSLIITKKAFELGLTNQVLIGIVAEAGGGNFTDPHNAFDDLAGSIQTVKFFGMFLDRFYADLAKAKDPACLGSSLDKTVILTVHGDHPHDPLSRPGWKDSTPGNANWMFCMGNGWLPTGWHGQARPDNKASGIDPTTGLETKFDGTVAAHSSSAAVLYSVVKGDMKRVKEYYKGPDITALVKTPG